ncbi:MAG: hypothetical protein LAP87_05580 [Acidobacteriia bacterium]|nr:hypothetical protein [Terriglobia bacterium]
MAVQRVPLSGFDRAQFNWSTQFNDLRSPSSSGATRQERDKRLTREIKTQALFERRTLIRDADVVNNLELLSLIVTDAEGVQIELLGGGHLLCLRSGAESFTEVNETAGTRRAYPSRYLKLRRLIKLLDLTLADKCARVLEVDKPGTVDTFRANLERICRAPFLPEPDKELLGKAMQRSGLGLRDRFLRFGDVYDYLVRHRRLSPQSDLIQWCRAAHTLSVPKELGIAPSTLDQDFAPMQVAYVLGHDQACAFNAAPWRHLFPRRIISDEVLDGLEFKTIMRFRHLASEIGYFDAVETLRASFGSSSGGPFVSYLKCLDEYFLAMRLEAKVELYDWQAELARRCMETGALQEQALAYGIPVVLASAYSLITQAPFPISEAVAVAAGIELLRGFYRTRKPRSPGRLMSGTTVVPVHRP